MVFGAVIPAVKVSRQNPLQRVGICHSEKGFARGMRQPSYGLPTSLLDLPPSVKTCVPMCEWRSMKLLRPVTEPRMPTSQLQNGILNFSMFALLRTLKWELQPLRRLGNGMIGGTMLVFAQPQRLQPIPSGQRTDSNCLTAHSASGNSLMSSGSEIPVRRLFGVFAVSHHSLPVAMNPGALSSAFDSQNIAGAVVVLAYRRLRSRCRLTAGGLVRWS